MNEIWKGYRMANLWPPGNKKIIPACEGGNNASYIAGTVEGMKKMFDAGITDTFIVSTRVGREKNLEDIRAKTPPDITIIPGIKANDNSQKMLANFDSINHWIAFNQCVERVANICPVGKVWLDLEWALRSVEGDKTEYIEPQNLNYYEFSDALTMLKPDLEYLWYRAVPAAPDPIQEVAFRVSLVAAAVLPKIMLVDNASVNGPNVSAAGLRAGLLTREIGAPTAGMIYFQGQGAGYYSYDDIENAITRSTSHYKTLILFPGTTYWVEMADAII